MPSTMRSRVAQALQYALKIFNYFFTAVFILEAAMKLVALGALLYFRDRWNQLDVMIVVLSVVGIVLEEVQSKIIPINPTIIRVMRVLRIARGAALKVGNLGSALPLTSSHLSRPLGVELFAVWVESTT
ncbi:T-type low-voltage-activated (LVA) calcium channel [Gryllus bimaculatus]|nr:T-type low-voltage-activated (LVA) calcium channel [Gryllus bimaculatus]